MIHSQSRFAIRRLAPLSAFLLIVIAVANTASASPIIYFYQGNSLETSGVYECPPVCNLSGSFILESALDPNRQLESPLTPMWYSFTNGLNTFTPLTTGFGGATFRFSTDPSGTIEEWSVQLVLNGDGTYFQTWHTPSGFITPFTTADSTFVYDCFGTPLVCAPIGRGFIQDQPGTWTSMPFTGPSPAPVPEPGTLLLLGSGLAIAASKARRRS